MLKRIRKMARRRAFWRKCRRMYDQYDREGKLTMKSEMVQLKSHAQNLRITDPRSKLESQCVVMVVLAASIFDGY